MSGTGILANPLRPGLNLSSIRRLICQIEEMFRLRRVRGKPVLPRVRVLPHRGLITSPPIPITICADGVNACSYADARPIVSILRRKKSSAQTRHTGAARMPVEAITLVLADHTDLVTVK